MDRNVGSIKLGTRGSALALRQTEIAAASLKRCFPRISISVHVVQTTGDRVQDRPIWQLGDKGVFVRPLERALLEGEIDIAVHSLKDVPADAETRGLQLAAYLAREDARDALVCPSGLVLDTLPSGARVGTSSLRRRMQLARLRADLVALDIRGNVDTRLRKLEDGQYDAIILAAAGLRRLGLEKHISEYIAVERFIPDAGQGILALQARTDDQIAQLLQVLDNQASRAAASAERAVVRALGAGCHSPVGAYAELDDGFIHVRAIAGNESGTVVTRAEGRGAVEEAANIGKDVGLILLSRL